MDTSAEANAAYVRKLVEARGMTEPLSVLAAREVAGESGRPAPWSYNYCLAYSHGHNYHRLGGKRLDHYANAYADICELYGQVNLIAFFEEWDGGHTFEGTAGEYWHLA